MVGVLREQKSHLVGYAKDQGSMLEEELHRQRELERMKWRNVERQSKALRNFMMAGWLPVVAALSVYIDQRSRIE